jgi:hypothetical protein
VSTAFRPLRSLGATYGLSSVDFRLFSPPFRGTFQRSFALLMHYRSQDVFRIGSLYLPASRAISNARYSGYLQSRLFHSPTGLSPSAVRRSSHVRLQKPASTEVHYSTSPHPRRAGIRFVLSRFRSPLLTASQLISCPPPTRIFRLDAGIRRLHRNHKFAEPLAKTVALSFHHSCRSELTPQGISLP